MKVVYMSQFRDTSGYAVAARGYLHALYDHIQTNKLNVELRALAFRFEEEMAGTVPEQHEALLRELEFSTLEEAQTYVNNNKEEYILVWHMPAPALRIIERAGGSERLYDDEKWRAAKLLVENCKFNININAWEADSYPAEWKTTYEKYNTRFAMVPSDENLRTFRRSFPEIQAFKIPHVLYDKKAGDINPIKSLEEVIRNKFVIFSMSQWDIRKGFDRLLYSYFMEFKNQEDVILILKTYTGLVKAFYQHNDIDTQFRQIASEISSVKQSIVLEGGKHPTAQVALICNALPWNNIEWLYSVSDLFALMTRGEGFGLPIAEAAKRNLPILATDEGGHNEILQHAIIPPAGEFTATYPVDSIKSPYIGKYGYTCDMNWNEPLINSGRRQLRKAYEELYVNKKGDNLKYDMSAFELEAVGEQFCEMLMRIELD